MATNSSAISGSAISATAKGTKIVKPGSDMDKNAFLRLLSAELTNQDPMNTKDSTAYVTQMAQFASMEQTSNLNSTMANLAANSLVGKNVVTNVNDANGVPYSGKVKDVTNNSGKLVVGVEINKNGKSEIYDFNFDEITSVVDTPNNSLDTLSGNTALFTAAALIGKKAELNVKDSKGDNISGLIKGVIRESGLIKLRVLPNNSSEEMTVSMDSISKLEMV